MSSRILLAEDNPINQLFLKTFLTSVGLELDIVSDGEAAVRACAEEKYDVVIMDYELPILDGPTATRLIRRLDIAQPKIIALTARSVTGDRHECLRSGMDDFVSKPFRGPALLSVIKQAIAGRGTNWTPRTVPQPG